MPRRTLGPPRISLNLTSMIDVVFLLLVYFMVATEFRLGEEVYRLDLPERARGVARDPFALDDEPLRIAVDSAPMNSAGYRLRIEGPYPVPDSFDALHDFLVRSQLGADTPDGFFPPDHPLVIEPGAETTWQHAMQAFDAAARAGYTNVTLAGGGA